MKWSIFSPLRFVGLVCVLLSVAFVKAEWKATDHLGGTMFIGDSITHGSRDANLSWRWWMHRLLVDNRIPYEEVGVVRGSHIMRRLHSELNVDVVYRDSVFHNLHAAYSGSWSADVVGKRKSNKFRNTTIAQWLGRVPCSSAEIEPVDGKKISSYFVLLGTNDSITPPSPQFRCVWDADKVNAMASDIEENLGMILKEIKACNPDARVVFIEIPTWYQWDDAAFVPNHMQGVQEINKRLRAWAQAQGDGVTMVSADAGVVDVAAAIKGRGLKCMYAERNANGLHPNDQGSLLIAGNVAKALGYAGATAGQARRHSEAFECDMKKALGRSAPLVIGQDELVSGKWRKSPSGAFSLSFALSGGVGNGEAEGWDMQRSFRVSVGNGKVAGTLHIKEAYLLWNDAVLYSLDASAGLPGELRIAYVQGEPERGLKPGFYVWLGDQLIGEGLPSSGATDGVLLSNGTVSEVVLSSLFMDSTGSYAPESDGVRGR